MPGNILTARCDCGGFQREPWPGATVTHLKVIAYSADGRDLITVESEQAKLEGLRVIKTPDSKSNHVTDQGAGYQRMGLGGRMVVLLVNIITFT